MSKEWMETFQDAKLTNIEVTTSDHCPIFLEPMTEKIVLRTKRFRFENAWLREPMCKKIVEETWDKTQSGTFQDRINTCSDLLASWGKEITGNFKKRIDHINKVLKATR